MSSLPSIVHTTLPRVRPPSPPPHDPCTNYPSHVPPLSRRSCVALPHLRADMETQPSKFQNVAAPPPGEEALPGTAASSTAVAAAAVRAPLSLLDVSALVASGGWLDLRSGKHLQEASGTLCRDCREYIGSHLRVDYSTPRVLWPLRMAGVALGGVGGAITTRLERQEAVRGRGLGVGSDLLRVARGSSGSSGAGGGNWKDGKKSQDGNRNGNGNCNGSIPRLRVTGMTWERPLGDLAHGRALPAGLEDLYFACSCRYFDVDWVSFPSSLLSLSFGQNFDQGIDTVAWPACLQRLTFGWEFNQSIDGVQWPSGLKRLTFGQSFDQPIDSVSWPLGLEDLTFGGRFHQPIHRVAFPPGLRRLTFGWRFNHPIAEVVWPARLQRLMFGSLFNQVTHTKCVCSCAEI